MSDNKKHSVSFTVDGDTKDKLDKLADQEERALGPQVSYLFKKYVFPHLDPLLEGKEPVVKVQ